MPDSFQLETVGATNCATEVICFPSETSPLDTSAPLPINAEPTSSVVNTDTGPTQANALHNVEIGASRFSGRPFRTLYFLELMAGCARFTSVVLKNGIQGIGVDHSHNRHSKVGPTVNYDLTKVDHQNILWELLEGGQIDIVHAAPPCGTGSKAREIRLSANSHGPPQLRSDSHLYGIPGMSQEDWERVNSANILWDFCARFIFRADELGCLVSAENPQNAYMWKCYSWPALVERFYEVLFQNCMHGGKRAKWSLWVSNWKALQGIAATCDGNHEHLPWGVKRTAEGTTFATAEEAEYPLLLCVRVVAFMVFELIQRGAVPPPVSLQNVSGGQVQNLVLERAAASRQPKRSKIPPLVPEFNTVFEEPAAVSSCTVGSRDERGYKLLRQDESRGDGGSKATTNIWAVPWTTTEFVDRALEAKHPFALQAPLPTQLLETIHFVASHSPRHVVETRTAEVKRWISLSKELEQQERELHERLHPQVGKVLQGKRLLLFKRLLEESGYEDKNLFEDMIAGFPVVGIAAPTGVFEKRIKPPLVSVEELRRSAAWKRHAVLSSVNRNNSNHGFPAQGDLDEDVIIETELELSKGWLIETTAEDLDRRFGRDGWTPAKRFPLKQGTKTRPIDDYSISGVNGAYGSTETVNLMGLDTICNLILTVARVFSSGRCEFSLPDKVVFAQLHPAWADHDSSIVGRLLDLWKAYRGLAFSPEDETARWTIIAVWCPRSNRTRLFLQPVLAFGAASSVLSFNRISRAIWFIGVKLGKLLWLNYFDDYPQTEPVCISKSALLCAEALVEVLGWKVSRGDKRLDFKPEFFPLGAAVNTSFLKSEGILLIGNKPNRVEEIVESLQAIKLRNTVYLAELDKLRGRLQFAESFVFGRFSRFVFVPFCEKVRARHRSLVPLDARLREAIDLLIALLNMTKPRRFPVKFSDVKFDLFTDGACEGELHENASVGASVFLNGGASRFWFGLQLPMELVHYWQTTGDKLQIIAESELLPNIIAREMLGPSDDTRLLVHYVDNDGVTDALIKGFSGSVCIRTMLRLYIEQECKLGFISWVTRVASPSNPADGPSRLECPFKDRLDRGVDRTKEARAILKRLLPTLTRRELG